MQNDINNLKATLAELGWTTTVSSAPDLACEALRTLHAALERRKVEAEAARAEIWKYKNALRDAIKEADQWLLVAQGDYAMALRFLPDHPLLDTNAPAVHDAAHDRIEKLREILGEPSDAIRVSFKP